MRNETARPRLGPIAYAPLAAVAWFFFALLGLAVRFALFRRLRGQGATSVLWGIGFALFLWFSLWALKVKELNAILFALVAGAAIALFVYLRGAGLEGPPSDRPGVFHREALARRRAKRAARAARRPPPAEPRDLHRARIEIARGDVDDGLRSLREAERVAVAQRKLAELIEVRRLADGVATRGWGQTRETAAELAQRVADEIYAFPADELVAAGIEPRPDPLVVVLARPAPPADPAVPKTRELPEARAAIEAGDLAAALFLLDTASRAAVAQRRLGELREAYELARKVDAHSSGRTHARSDDLLRRIEAGLRSFA
jgi:hypothetical protein